MLVSRVAATDQSRQSRRRLLGESASHSRLSSVRSPPFFTLPRHIYLPKFGASPPPPPPPRTSQRLQCLTLSSSERGPIDRGSDRPIIEKGPIDRGADRPIIEKGPVDRGSDSPIIEKGPIDRGSDRPIIEKGPVRSGGFPIDRRSDRPRVR